uniref:NADH dehydrogenase subunit 3 n=1 Tax=Anagyrus jenniferae TaxID=2058195 RepID=UPI002E76DE09|nr:NADH dehydrogenase subunit 3 [Anagyrus jenniferae]WPT46942.1 NADH dehydrogenase subunit 3 [Anagyrus jenniferae]
MLFNLFFMIMIFLILIILIMVNFVLSKKLIKDREKMSSFECGFDSLSQNRLPFSLQFFLISVIFLIFDIEIVLIFPFIYMNNYIYYFMILNMLFIILFLILGLYVEWIEGALKWFK